ncbi:hypothetical protein BZG36_01033 [Bifiguratus adelaidae]|uniref:Calcineurin-like phosphoesterase domain-containing protein n=1 Tax=Bifiguratus adelaidae TaxID=1938954 RepID=A0A261Y6A6_9FUNG|nr:hypothetical protein BZG36_01033 [Bifiguratus adelaidae]
MSWSPGPRRTDILRVPLRLITPRRNIASVLKVAWVIVLWIGEVGVFWRAAAKCQFPVHLDGVPSHKVVLIGDPQITDPYSYHRRGVLQWVTEFYSDLYMRRNWRNLMKRRKRNRVDTVIFMGDLMDGGREWEDDAYVSIADVSDLVIQSGCQRYLEEAKRFKNLFVAPREDVKFIYMAGNHDLGFGNGVTVARQDRFAAEFNLPNQIFDMGNHSVVLLDTVSITSQDANVRAAVETLLNQVQDTQLPRILLTHVPLWRDDATDCGPLRQASDTITQGNGYQYQNLMDASMSTRLLTTVKPDLVFSGDNHDYCEIVHSYQANGERQATEITVPTFSMAQGLLRPGVILLTLQNPLDTNAPSLASSTYSRSTCFFPDQVNIFINYAYIALITIIIIILTLLRRHKTQNVYRMLKRNNNAFRLPLHLLPRRDPQNSVAERTLNLHHNDSDDEQASDDSDDGFSARRSRFDARATSGIFVAFRKEYWALLLRDVSEVAAVAVPFYVFLLVWNRFR